VFTNDFTGFAGLLLDFSGLLPPDSSFSRKFSHIVNLGKRLEYNSMAA
jgi:hypothetical protein